MALGKKHSPEQVVNLLRQIEVAIANGKMTGLACVRPKLLVLAGTDLFMRTFRAERWY